MPTVPNTGAYAREMQPDFAVKPLPDFEENLRPVFAINGDDSFFLGVAENLSKKDLEIFDFEIDEIIFLEGSIQVVVR